MLGKQELHRMQMYGMLLDWKQSGLSQISYCRAKGISYRKLKYWLHKQRNDESFTQNFMHTRSSFLPIEVDGEFSSNEEEFLLRLHYPNGVVLEVSSLLPNQTLMELIKKY